MTTTKTIFGAELRRVENRDFEGKPAVVAVAVRSYDTTIDDLWSAVTTRERIARWIGPIDGDFRVGGSYKIQNNASGTITRCEPPSALDVTWEFGGGVSWVTVRLAREGAHRARFTLEHIAPRGGIGESHFEKFGPGAVGIGWDLMIEGLARHLADPAFQGEPAWLATDEAKAFMRAAGEGWFEAHVASGADRADARTKADNTLAAYTGG